MFSLGDEATIGHPLEEATLLEEAHHGGRCSSSRITWNGYWEDEALVLSVVSTLGSAIVPEFHEPPQKDQVVVILGTPKLAMPSTSRLPTSKGGLKECIQKPSTKKLSGEPESAIQDDASRVKIKITHEEPVSQKSIACHMLTTAKDVFVGKPGLKSHTNGSKHSSRPAKNLLARVGLPAGEKRKVSKPGVILKKPRNS